MAIVKIRISFLFLGLCAGIALAGCGQSLQTLIEVDAEQRGQRLVVEGQTRRFELLLADAESGALSRGTSRAEILERYGEPIVTQGATLLYRRPVQFMGSPKVYLDFAAKDTLADARVVR